MHSQVPYLLIIVCLFLFYGTIVRRGLLSGRGIIGIGLLVGLAAVTAAFFSVPASPSQAVTAPRLIVAVIYAVCTAACIALAHRSQQVKELAVFAVGDTKITVRYAPASRIEADALLLPVITTLRMLGGVSGAVAAAAGPEVSRAVRAAAPVGLGKVVATTGGRLAVDRIFHVAVHEPLRPTEEGNLRRGVENAAQQARKAGAQTLAVPISGLHGMPTARVAAVTAEAVLKQRRAFSEILFVCLEMRHARTVREAVEQAVGALVPMAR